MKASLNSYAQAFCTHHPDSWHVISELGSGNSATVYHVCGDEGDAALKVYDPKFFQGRNAIVETRRINDQLALRGHGHPNLVDFLGATEVEGTYCLLMEYLPWPTIEQRLTTIDRNEIAGIIAKIASAAKFLERRGLVHRDIKPSNVLISDDYNDVKLLDLGVMRPISTTGTTEATDRGYELPFVATAQYSSPAYLFREGEPTEEMWRALTFYQLGAILHDLVMRRPIFDDDVRTGNRYRVAAAVYSTLARVYARDVPSWLLALARNCLVKRDDHRLKRVDWTSFDPKPPIDLDSIRTRLGLTEHAAPPDPPSQPPMLEYIKVRLDEIATMLRVDCTHVFRKENFPNSTFHHGPSDERSRTLVFSFRPEPDYPDVSLSYALRIAVREESDDEIDITLASFLNHNEDAIFPRDISFLIWSTSLIALSTERQEIVQLLIVEFILRFSAALDELPSYVERVDIPVLKVERT